MNTADVLIIRRLLQAGEAFVSGNELGTELAMSRVSIWTHLERLKRQGFAFEAVRRRGYRLVTVPESLNPTLVQAHCSLRSLPTLEFRQEVDSTNSEAERLLAGGSPTPLVVISRSQSKGRGRLGRTWTSPDCGNLYASFAFRPRIPPAQMQTFTLWMGVNVCETLRNFGRFTPSVKWPNDILFEGRKLGGMLTEARIDTDQIRDVVFGLGLNVNRPADGWPEEVAGTAISLSEIIGQSVDINRMTAALIGRVMHAYDTFVSGDHSASFKTMWERFDLLRGNPVTIIQGNETIRGIARGINRQGALQLELPDGTVSSFLAGDVTLAKAPRP
jgi:BirA family biotin operon repressor/biotin-[acetyl-CoA-carboxylase] ligase